MSSLRAPASRRPTARACSRSISARGPTSTATTSRRRTRSGRRATATSACGATRIPIRISRGPISWLGDIGVQHELFGGLGLSVSYDHRRLRQQLSGRAAWSSTRSTIHARSGARSARQRADAAGLQPRAGQARPGQRASTRTRRTTTTRYRGMDVTVNGRWRGATFLGGTSTGRTLSITCDVADPNNLRFCDQSESDVPLQTQFKLAGSVTCRTACAWERTSRAGRGPNASSPTRSCGRSCRR